MATVRPSDARRAALSQEEMGEKGIPLVSNFFPLDRYYDATERVLEAFNEAFDKRRLDDAYVYGKRFAIFSLNALPNHNYYNAPRYSQARAKNQRQMSDVVYKLEYVAKWMDAEEIEKERERRKLLAERKRHEMEKQKKEADIARIRLQQWQKEQQKQNLRKQKSCSNVEQSALDKLKLLNGSSGSSGNGQEEKWGESVGSLNLNDGPKSKDQFMNDLQRSFGSSRGDLSRDSSAARNLGRKTSSQRAGMLSRESSQRSLQSNDSGRVPRRRASNSGSPSVHRAAATVRRGSNDSSSNHHEQQQQQQQQQPQRRRSITSREGRRRPERRMSGDQQPLPPPMAPPSGTENGFPPPPSYTSVVPVVEKGGARNNNNTNNIPTNIGFPPSALEQAAAHAAAAAGGATARRGRPSTVRDPFPSSSGSVCSTAASGSFFANRELERQHRATKNKEKVPFMATKQRARDKVSELKGNKRVQVMPIATHQGRMRNSTNGCAVISPLVVSHHLRSRVAVENHEIVDVIDRECIPLLREIRTKLGLGSDALIIPSDVHDHLVDKKVLRQDSFVGATGGNIMDRKHLAEFLRLLNSGEKNSHSEKRTGAALFFREHVVSIVKVPLGGGKWAFDLIDSLPSLSNGSDMQATRTRCRDLSAFESYVRYYASNKLSESSCAYIDKNEWNDMMADFDPRVFQGFVWGDC